MKTEMKKKTKTDSLNHGIYNKFLDRLQHSLLFETKKKSPFQITKYLPFVCFFFLEFFQMAFQFNRHHPFFKCLKYIGREKNSLWTTNAKPTYNYPEKLSPGQTTERKTKKKHGKFNEKKNPH